MIAELAKDYRGVLCRRRREPIPVPSKLRDLQNEPTENVSSTFPARCHFCEYESVYAVRDIRKFEGKPRNRKS
jgi:hypothetical protein